MGRSASEPTVVRRGGGQPPPFTGEAGLLMFDFPLVLAALLLGIALVLAALGIALSVGGLADGLFGARILLGVLLHVPAFLAILRLLGGQRSARDRQQAGGNEHSSAACQNS